MKEIEIILDLLIFFLLCLNVYYILKLNKFHKSIASIQNETNNSQNDLNKIFSQNICKIMERVNLLGDECIKLQTRLNCVEKKYNERYLN